MKKLIAGRLTQDGQPVATIMVDLFFRGLRGEVVLRQNAKATTYVSPANFLKLFLDYMLKLRELALKTKAAKKNSMGSGGGIRVVLLNPGTPTEESASSGPVPVQSPAPNPEDAFDPAELVEGAGRAPRQES